MLVVTRKPGQDLYIQIKDKVIVVRVAHIYGRKVQIGITADPDVNIVRGEILNKYPLESSTPKE